MNDFQMAAAKQADIIRAKESYMAALRAVIALREIEAGLLLNDTKAHVLRATGKPHWTALKDEDFRIIHPTLSLSRLNALYGDCTPSTKPQASTPWVRDRGLIGVIGTHIHDLGTDDDLRAFGAFCNQYHSYFQGNLFPALRIA